MAKFYDPITERWHEMRAPVEQQRSVFQKYMDALAAQRAGRLSRDAERIWEAVTATATASQMGTEETEDAGFREPMV